MKRLVAVAALAGLLSACGTTGSNVTQHSPAAAQFAISQAPEWMSKLPKSENAVYENGTAVHPDFAMADLTAKTLAYAKICTAAGGKVRSQMKVFGNDQGTSTELAVRSICPDVDITGVETIEMKHVAEGNRIRTYVLVALPMGSSNVMKTNKETARSSKEAFKELDEIVTGKPSESGTPTPKVKGDEVSVVRPDGTSSTLNLLPVENAEYKQKREEALQKPGAVVGQITLQN